MAVTYKKIETEIEHVWYQSSNIYYTKVNLGKQGTKTFNEIPGIEIPNVPTVDVTVVFNRGAQYLYKDVELHDYISFRDTLNRETDSHGKNFILHIKKFPVEKQDDMNMDELQELKVKFLKEDKRNEISHEKERISKMSFQEKVEECFNIQIDSLNNQNTKNEDKYDLIEWYGQEVFDRANEQTVDWIKNLLQR